MGALGSNHVLADQRGGGAACWRRAAVAAAALAVPLAAAGIAPPPASATGGYTVTATIPVAAGPRAVAVDAATHTVHVTNQGENGTVTVIDETTNTVIHTIPVGTFPTDVAVNLSTNTIYVTNYADNTVSAGAACGRGGWARRVVPLVSGRRRACWCAAPLRRRVAPWCSPARSRAT